jgi:TolA-binding protein
MSGCPHPEQLAALASGDTGDTRSVATDVAAHVATCLPCRAIVADQRSIAELARRTLPPPTLSRVHRDRIAAEVMASSDDLPASPHTRWSPGIAIVALAAALVIGIGIAALVSASLGHRTPDNGPIARTPDSRTPDNSSRMPDNRTRDNRTSDSRTPDNRTPDNSTRTPDNAARTPDSRTPDNRTSDSRTPDSRTPDNSSRTPDNSSRTPDSRTPDNRTPDKSGRTAVARIEGSGGELAREAGQTSDRVQLDDGAVTIDARGTRPVEIATPGARVRIGDAKVSVLARQGVIETVTVIAGTVEVTSRGQRQVIETGTIWERDHAVDAAFEAFREGWTALRASKYADAIAAFDRASDPAVAEDAQYWAAVASEREGGKAEARRRFGEFVKRFPTSPRADAARAALARLPQ